jgi:CTP synthase
MPEQQNVSEKGGTMRLGLYPCHLIKGTKAHAAYQTNMVEERHRHRFELNNDFRPALESDGMICSGVSPDNRLVEITEIKDHPFMLGTQFHPEFLSRPNRPHPLFSAFIRAVCERVGISKSAQ